MSGEEVFLGWIWLTSVEIGLLEDGGGVSKDEIDGAVDVAFTEELAEGVNVESVLEGNEAAFVEDGEI